MKSFGLIGVAGYIAPRHLRAIRDTGNNLIWAVDPCDSVGILDQFFPKADYFHNRQDLGAYLHHGTSHSSLITHHSSPAYVSICSPNYLHEEHIRWALEQGTQVICEKPLVTSLEQLDKIQELEKASGRNVNTIMQLRLHPVVQEIGRRRKEEGGRRKVVKLEYITARGRWYFKSWKGIEELSGGIAMNIGIHLFDMVVHLFGPMKESRVSIYQPDRASGILELEDADVEWFLSINEQDLPKPVRESGKQAFRNITVNGQPVEFTEGFTELHTESYRQILAGRGFDTTAVRESLRVVEEIRRKR